MDNDELKSINERLTRIEEMMRLQKSVLDLEEAATYIGYSKNYLYKMTAHNKIPHYKRARKLFFNRGELDQWLQDVKIMSDDEINSQAETYCKTHSIKRLK